MKINYPNLNRFFRRISPYDRPSKSIKSSSLFISLDNSLTSGTPIVPAPFQSLIKKGEPVAIPIKKFNVCAGLVQKDEYITRNRVLSEIIPHNPSQSIEA